MYILSVVSFLLLEGALKQVSTISAKLSSMCYDTTRPVAFKDSAVRNEKDPTSFWHLASWIQLARVFSFLPINFE